MPHMPSKLTLDTLQEWIENKNKQDFSPGNLNNPFYWTERDTSLSDFSTPNSIFMAPIVEALKRFDVHKLDILNLIADCKSNPNHPVFKSEKISKIVSKIFDFIHVFEERIRSIEPESFFPKETRAELLALIEKGDRQQRRRLEDFHIRYGYRATQMFLEEISYLMRVLIVEMWGRICSLENQQSLYEAAKQGDDETLLNWEDSGADYSGSLTSFICEKFFQENNKDAVLAIQRNYFLRNNGFYPFRAGSKSLQSDAAIALLSDKKMYEKLSRAGMLQAKLDKKNQRLMITPTHGIDLESDEFKYYISGCHKYFNSLLDKEAVYREFVKHENVEDLAFIVEQVGRMMQYQICFDHLREHFLVHDVVKLFNKAKQYSEDNGISFHKACLALADKRNDKIFNLFKSAVTALVLEDAPAQSPVLSR